MKRYLVLLWICLILLMTAAPVLASGHDRAAESRDQLIALASDALISAGDKNWNHVSVVVSKLKLVWTDAAGKDPSTEAKAVAEALTRAEQELSKADKDGGSAYQAVSALAKTIDSYVSSGEDNGTGGKANKQIQTILPLLTKSLSEVKAGEWLQAKQSYTAFISSWSKAESLVRQENTKAYRDIEVKISGARIALNTEPLDEGKGSAKLQELITILENYSAGNVVTSPSAPSDNIQTIGALLELLDSVDADVQNQRGADALEKMDRFIAAWPSAEGEVMTRSNQAYRRIETTMVAIPSLLLSNPPQLERAKTLIDELRKELEPYEEASSYSAWDAGVILFREGLEAMLIIAALLAFLNRSGNADKSKWIWSGAGTGIAASAVLTIILSVWMTRLSTGGSRELIEGITGLIAVVFMVTIGAWLHSKSNLRTWNEFVEKTIGSSLAKGTLWSLSITAFLSVMREGAETIIFYIGMASTIQTADLLLGVGTALLLLAVIGYVMIKMSSRIPVRPFFLLASMLLYYLAFKFVGVSIHALQVTGKLSVHVREYFIDAPSFGLYANWETTSAQFVVLAVILWNVSRTVRKTEMGLVRKPLDSSN